MAKFDVKALNYITCGPKQNTFNLEYRYTNDGMIQSKPPQVLSVLLQSHTDTFFGDVGEDETMSQYRATNKMSFYDISNDMIIHGMYKLSKLKMRSTATKHGFNAPNIDVYLPSISDDFIGVC